MDNDTLALRRESNDDFDSPVFVKRPKRKASSKAVADSDSAAAAAVAPSEPTATSRTRSTAKRGGRAASSTTASKRQQSRTATSTSQPSPKAPDTAASDGVAGGMEPAGAITQAALQRRALMQFRYDPAARQSTLRQQTELLASEPAWMQKQQVQQQRLYELRGRLQATRAHIATLQHEYV